jgi:ubiquinone/menaquinone biosynthesis C-methylase UbiE
MAEQPTPPVIDYEGSDYQQIFWESGEREYEDRVEALALRRLLPAEGYRLLELGAGAGRNTPRYGGYQQVVLLDYSLTQLQQAQARLGQGGRYLYVAANIYHLPFCDGIFDAATMIRTLHHMADAPLALRQIHLSLEPGATFILEYANKQNLKAILRYFLRRQAWNPFTPEPVEFVHLNFDFHPASIRRWLRETGFEIDRQLTVSHFRIDLLKRVLPLSLLVKLDSAAQLTGDWWQLSPSVFVGARASGKPGQTRPARHAENIFCCPVCKSDALRETPQGLACPECKRVWPLVGGIYDFRAA